MTLIAWIASKAAMNFGWVNEIVPLLSRIDRTIHSMRSTARRMSPARGLRNLNAFAFVLMNSRSSFGLVKAAHGKVRSLFFASGDGSRKTAYGSIRRFQLRGFASSWESSTVLRAEGRAVAKSWVLRRSPLRALDAKRSLGKPPGVRSLRPVPSCIQKI